MDRLEDIDTHTERERKRERERVQRTPEVTTFGLNQQSSGRKETPVETLPGMMAGRKGD